MRADIGRTAVASLRCRSQCLIQPNRFALNAKRTKAKPRSKTVPVPKTVVTEGPPLSPEKPNHRHLVFATALASMILLWTSFPPLGIWWLAWLAPAPIIWLVVCVDLPSANSFRQIWLAALLYWLATFYFIPIPHPALWLGWLVVSLYMSIYTPLFVFVLRTMVHRLRLPSIVAVPIVWTGIEWIRCNFATGMAMACLSHTQYEHPLLIQVADLSVPTR